MPKDLNLTSKESVETVDKLGIRETKLIIKIRKDQEDKIKEFLSNEDNFKHLLEKQISYFPELYKDINKIKIEIKVVD